MNYYLHTYIILITTNFKRGVKSQVEHRLLNAILKLSIEKSVSILKLDTKWRRHSHE
jgi:hypothetical protein